MNRILNAAVAVFRRVVLWAAQRHPDKPSSAEAETMVGDIVYGLLTTRTFKRIWRITGRPHVVVQVTPNHIIDIRRATSS